MAFQQGLSGLSANAKALDVVGNNIANSNTVGFKQSKAHFSDVYSAAMGIGASTQVGIGVAIPAIMQQFTQSNVETTNYPLDLAINGDGFFQVQRGFLNGFTRNGQFHLDKSGAIVNDDGFNLMGYGATSTGQIIPANPIPLQVDVSNIPPRPTGDGLGGDMIGNFNLDSRKQVPPQNQTGDRFNPANLLTYTDSQSLTVFDTLGVPHSMSVFFVRGPQDGYWDLWATLDGDNSSALPIAVGDYSTTPPSAGPATTSTTPGFGTNFQATSTPGALHFNTNGTLVGPVAPPANQIIRLPSNPPGTGSGGWNLNTGASSPLGSSNNGGLPNWNIDMTGTTSFGGDFSANKFTQGGFTQGAISSIFVDKTGVLQGKYSNGQSRPLGQVVIADFANPNGLVNLGNNLLQETSESGGALIGAAGSGRRGLIQGSAVEVSNVDLTVQLVDMITLQRAYQANAQTIKTQDQIMQTIVNLR